MLAWFAGSSKELRDHLQQVDFSFAEHPDRSLKETIFEALKARRVEAKVNQEAVERVLELERSNLLVDPADVDRPIREHPLFQRDLQHVAIFKLADVANSPMPDRKSHCPFR